MGILTDSSIPNPLNGILPNFTIFGAQFTELWQKLIAGMWAIAIVLTVVFLIVGVTQMASASSGGNWHVRHGNLILEHLGG